MLNNKNKIGDGGAIATDDRIIYAIKGKGKQDFWMYTPFVRGDTGVWTPLETVPLGTLGKKGGPKTGAALAYIEGNIFLLKGNKTDEFWQYIPSFDSITKLHPSNITSATSTQTLSLIEPTLNVAPNPFTKLTTIKYTVPIWGKVTIKLYNAVGRLVQTLYDDHLKPGTYTTNLSANSLANGIYILRYETMTNRPKIKLIVQ